MSKEISSESDSTERIQDLNEAWSELRTISDPKSYARVWLASQLQLIGDGVHQAVVVLSTSGNGAFTPVAIWPEGSMGNPALVTAIEAVIKTSEPIVKESARSNSSTGQRQKINLITTPLIVDGKVCGAIGLETDELSKEQQQDIISKINWGSAWLEALLVRNKLKLADRLVGAVELMATALDHEHFQGAATAAATELAGELLCERVSIGLLKSKHVKIAALSHSADFGKKANIIRAIEAAMDEAIDQQATIQFPDAKEGPLKVTRSHEQLVSEHGSGTICTVPLAQGERMLGAITLERPRDNPFDAVAIAQCEQIASLLGPLLDVKRRDDRLLITKVVDSFRDSIKKLIGPRHVLMKLLTSGALLLLVFFSFATGDYRVTANARLEGEVQRAIATPIAGYVTEANVRAGDIVKKGDVMFALDDSELQLELVKWGSQKSQYSREYADASARHDRAEASVLAAQIEQAEANIALVEQQLSRINGIAPFDGVVVSGDLSQSLGAPLERGDILFEVAPLNDYRVILEVEERDIAELQVGQTGQLVLTGMPMEKIAFSVEKITPVASSEEGVNYFRVDAQLTDPSSLSVLRPGMEGVGKVSVEERKLIWIWTYKVRYWLRMFFWSWMP